ncbi:hypothetical protein [Hymenobacter pini]|uniref:hypothetical protein n=1 Tax=Hymenobacter pini TaxID=2880879 RepID=UPI001CF2B537|nr:hypothetical protein [Hymenobacter pini]MCA8830433.1 hypothetical protein [Hymenobacter pini]
MPAMFFRTWLLHFGEASGTRKVFRKVYEDCLLICEAATAIVLMQDCMTRFQNHGGTTALPYVELEFKDEAAARQRVAGILHYVSKSRGNHLR